MRGVLVSVLFCLLSAPALAAPRARGEEAAKEDEAKYLAALAVEAYQAADYPRVVTLLTRAYEIRPLATLLYNLAKAYDKMGKNDLALENYHRYLDAGHSDPKMAANAEGRIASLEAQLNAKAAEEKLAAETAAKQAQAKQDEQRAAAERAAERAEKERRAAQSLRRKTFLGIGIGLAAVGVAAIGGGIGLYAAAASKHDAFAASRDETAKQHLKSEAQSLGLGSTVLYAVGGILAAGGVAMALTGGIVYADKSHHHDSVSLAPWLAPAGTSIAVGGSATWAF